MCERNGELYMRKVGVSEEIKLNGCVGLEWPTLQIVRRKGEKEDILFFDNSFI